MNQSNMGRKAESQVPILLYHDLESEDWPSEKTNPATRDTVVHVDRFESQIKLLAEEGFHSLTLDELFNCWQNHITIPKKSIVITFDDGHHSHYRLALPVLREYGFKATFFIIANRVGEPFHVNRKQVRDLVREGMEIGSHGLSHSYLPELDDEQIWREISRSRQVLEELCRKEVRFFAYPGGHQNPQVVGMTRNAGYWGACSCFLGLNHQQTEPYLLKRLEVRKRLELNDFKSMFHPGNLLFYQGIDSCKSVMRKTFGLRVYAKMRSVLYHAYRLKR